MRATTSGITVEELHRRARRDRLRGSLLFFPVLIIVGCVLLALVLLQLDDLIGDAAVPPALRMSGDAAITLLATIAGATITTAGVIFSLLVVSLQLASGQFSPRVLRGFHRDRFSQVVIGMLVGLFAYSVVAIRSIRPSENSVPDLTVDVATALSVATVLAIVVFLDRLSRLQYVGHIMGSIAAESIHLLDDLRDRLGDYVRRGDPPDPATLGPSYVVTADVDGWVQQMSSWEALHTVVAGSVVRFETRPGAFVVAGIPLATIWPPPADATAVEGGIRSAVVVGPTRTMQQDLDFGLRQLNDIGLRALSPAVNDPTTGIEAVLRVGTIMRRLMTMDLPPVARWADNGSVLLRPYDLDHDEYVAHAFDQMRVYAGSSPAVSIAMVRVLRMLAEAAVETGHPERVPAVQAQIRLVVEGCEQAGLLGEDLDRVRAAARPGS